MVAYDCGGSVHGFGGPSAQNFMEVGSFMEAHFGSFGGLAMDVNCEVMCIDLPARGDC